MYDYKSIIQYIIEDYFASVCLIDDCKTKSDRINLKNFRYKDDIKASNILGEFPEKISPQVKYPNPLTQIDIKNNETRYKL
jgi:hypothetical protein